MNMLQKGIVNPKRKILKFLLKITNVQYVRPLSHGRCHYYSSYFPTHVQALFEQQSWSLRVLAAATPASPVDVATRTVYLLSHNLTEKRCTVLSQVISEARLCMASDWPQLGNPAFWKMLVEVSSHFSMPMWRGSDLLHTRWNQLSLPPTGATTKWKAMCQWILWKRRAQNLCAEIWSFRRTTLMLQKMGIIAAPKSQIVSIHLPEWWNVG